MVSVSSFHLIYFVYPLVGIIAGFFAGLLGLGGGIIIVPCLLLVFPYVGINSEAHVHLAIGTSTAIVVMNLIVSALTHFKHRDNHILFPIIKRIFLAPMIGAIIAVLIASHLPGTQLALIFGLIVFALAARLLLIPRAVAALPVPHTQWHWPPKIALHGVMGTFGTLSILMGSGGGIFMVPFFQHCKIPLRYATAMSVACGLPLALVGAISYAIAGMSTTDLPDWTTGYIYWPAFIGVIITSMLVAPLGVKVSRKLPEHITRFIFIIMLIVIGLKMVV